VKPITELVRERGRMRWATQRWLQIMAARDLMRWLRSLGVDLEPFNEHQHDWR
jgi:hypothetical protein